MARNRPKTPEQIAADKARSAVLSENRAEARRLRAQGLEVTIDPRTSEVLGARRMDVVQMMATSRPAKLTVEQVTFYRELEQTLQDAGEGSRSCLSALDRVSGAGDGSAAMDRRMKAIRKLAERQSAMDAGSWAFLEELATGGGLLTRWRDVTRRRTGETNDDAQAGAVRQVIRTLEAVEVNLRGIVRSNDYIGGMIARASEAA